MAKTMDLMTQQRPIRMGHRDRVVIITHRQF